MVSQPDSSNGHTRIEAHGKHGHARFQRTNAGAFLEIDCVTPQAQTPLGRVGGLEEGIRAACEEEVAHMRRTLVHLGEQLVSQLSEHGKVPVLHRTAKKNRDERVWEDRGREFIVDESRTRMRENMKGYEGASDAMLVRETIRQIIQDRELGIRTVYRNILHDACAKRAEALASKLPDDYHKNGLPPARSW